MTNEQTHLLKIAPEDLVSLSALEPEHNIRIELAYARSDNLLLGEPVYRSDAQLWAHKDLAAIVLKAAESLKAQNLRLIVYDCLRTTDTQALMLQTQRVKDHPHWLEEPRLLSPPGTGAHPRGMAVDCALETFEGELLDMGTPFDFLCDDPSPKANPAHRQHPNLSPQVMQNRRILDQALGQAAEELGLPLWPLTQEWWDFRFPSEVSERYAPLSDADLPPEMRLALRSR
ncbi:MAG: D-Ala-D-Ala dipeptidase [Alphaproteobacteria bacterium]|nr:D-Ala-D-Ala dipeptidase [Alphaproteobacteria bacterium]